MVADSASVVLGIDVGTTSAKCALIDAAGHVISFASGELATVALPEGGAEQDANAMWACVRKIIHDAVAGNPGRTIAGLTCTGQYSSIVPVDKAGEPVHNLIVWMDQRGARYNQQIHEDYPDALMYWLDAHGLAPSPSGGASLAHMQWLQHNCSEAYAKTHAFLEPADYITGRLTGQIVSNACTVFPLLLTNHTHPDECAYDARMIEMSGLDAEKLPPLLDKSAVVGPVLPDLAAELGLPLNLPVFTPVNDTQAVTIATGSDEVDVAGLSIGTTSVLTSTVREKKSDLETFLFSMPSPHQGEYDLMAENGLGGKVIEHVLLNLFNDGRIPAGSTESELYTRFDSKVQQARAGSNGVCFLPYLGGSLAPSPTDYMRGSFMNLSLSSTQSDMERALVEGVCMNINWLKRCVEDFTGETFKVINLGGGGSRLSSVCQILADITGVPVNRMASPHALACIGAGLLTFERIGQSLEESRHQADSQTFTPITKNTNLYQEEYNHFLDFFHANEQVYQQINEKE